MNCKPGQRALVIHATPFDPCSHKIVGCPTKVEYLAEPSGLLEAVMQGFEGPVWKLEEPFRCPSGDATCLGIRFLPDRCLRPFDPDSMPEPEVADVECGKPVEVPHG